MMSQFLCNEARQSSIKKPVSGPDSQFQPSIGYWQNFDSFDQISFNYEIHGSIVACGGTDEPVREQVSRRVAHPLPAGAGEDPVDEEEGERDAGEGLQRRDRRPETTSASRLSQGR